jgi:hypothetical protein
MNDDDYEDYYEEQYRAEQDKHERDLSVCQKEIRRLRWAVRELTRENDDLRQRLGIKSE